MLGPAKWLPKVARPRLRSGIIFPVGNYTAANRSGVRATRLLAMRSGGKPLRWQWRVKAGTASHWTLPGSNGVVVEGSTAITPQPSSAGDSANLNGGVGGAYTWEVRAGNAGGWSNWVEVVVPIIPDAANMGDPNPLAFDNFPGAVVGVGAGTPAAFSTANGGTPKKILISRMADRGRSGLGFGAGFDFSVEVRIEHAYPAEYYPLSRIAIGLGGANFTIDGLTIDGPLTPGDARIGLSGVQDIKITNSRLGGGLDKYFSGSNGIDIGGTTTDRVLIEDVEIFHCENGVNITLGENITIRELYARYNHRAGVLLGPGLRGGSLETLPPPDVITIEDSVICSPYRLATNTTAHLDGIQQADDFEGYTELTGAGYVGNPTGVAQHLRLRRLVLGICDSNVGWSAYRGGRAGEHSSSEDLQCEDMILTGWEPFGLTISNGNGGYIKNVAVWRANTGDDTNTPSEGKNAFGGIGPSLVFYGRTALNWPGTVTLSHVHCYDDISIPATFDGGAPNYAAPTLGAGVVAYDRNTTAINAAYLNNPRTVLEGYTNEQYAAMGKEEIRELHKFAFRRWDSTGCVDIDGEWQSLSSGGGGTTGTDTGSGPPPETFNRVTPAGDRRVTPAGDVRIYA